MREILEAAEAVQEGVLTEAGLLYLQNSTIASLGPDPVIGDAAVKKLLQDALKEPVKPHDVRYYQLRDLADDLDANYVRYWSENLRQPIATGQVERAARSIASYLLDRGYSRQFVINWLRPRIFDASASEVLADIFDDLFVRVSKSAAIYEGLIPFLVAPAAHTTSSKAWMNATDASQWLKTSRFNPVGLRMVGAVLLKVEARDEHAAAARMRTLVERIVSRTQVGSRNLLTPCELLYVRGLSDPVEVARPRRGVAMYSLEREDRLYDVMSPAQGVDHATDLLAVLDGGPPAAAVATGWAAIESLLIAASEKGDLVRASDRLAAIATCSYPRAELTKLSHSHQGNGDALSNALRLARTNRERARTVADHIRSGNTLTVRRLEENVATNRMAALLTKPDAVLRQIHRYMTGALRRFYRQRNLVLHGGKTDGIALSSTLRTASPLIGAGMDRIHHAWANEKLDPVALAARAQTHLALIGSARSHDVSELLEP